MPVMVSKAVIFSGAFNGTGQHPCWLGAGLYATYRCCEVLECVT